MKVLKVCLLFLILVGVLLAGSARAANGSWGVDADGSWASSVNWVGGTVATGSTSAAYFTNAITQTRVVTLSAGAWRIAGLVFSNSGSYGFTIANGTLNLSSNVTVNPGNGVATLESAVSATTLVKDGSGRLNLNGTTTLGNLTVGASLAGGSVVAGSGTTISVGSGTGNSLTLGSIPGGGGGSGVLDVSASSRFTANVGTLTVGATARSNGGGGLITGSLYLGASNTITATTVYVGNGDGVGNPTGGAGQLTTADNGSTTMNTGDLKIGIGSMSATSFSLGADASLILQGSTGAGSRARVTIGDNGADWSATGTMELNLTNGVANLTLGSVIIGNSSSGGRSITGRLLLGSSPDNHLDVSVGSGNAIRVGYSSSTYNVNGTLTLGNLDATSTIAHTGNGTAVLLGYKGSSGASTGTLNLNGGTLTIATTGTAISGGGGTSTLNLKNCTLVAGASSTSWMSGLTAATLSGTVTLSSGTYTNVISQALSGTGKLVKDGAGVLVLSGLNTYTNTTTVSNGTLLVNGVITSAVTVVSGGTLGGTNTIKGNVTLQAGANAVFTYGAQLTINGALNLNGGNTVHLNLPANLGMGNTILGTYGTSGSSGSFLQDAVIDSGSAQGSPVIVTSGGVITLRIVTKGMLFQIE